MSKGDQTRPAITISVPDEGVETRTAAPRKDTAPPPEEKLFRSEVMEERQTQWLGTVLIEPKVSRNVFAGAAAVATCAILALLFFGSYTRKARIQGWLVPEQGLGLVVSPQSAIVTKVHVKEGAKVVKGAPLVSLSAEIQSEALGATREEVVRRLNDRLRSLTATKGVQEQMFAQQIKDAKQRLASLNSESGHLSEETKLQRTRLGVSNQGLARERMMQKRELISLTRLQRTEQEHLEQAGRLQALERSQSALHREEVALEGLLRELPLRQHKELAEVDRSTWALNQELAEAEARRQIVLTAPSDGVVTSIQAEPGGNAVPNAPLLKLVPEGATLEAHLFSPSRAIGFVKPGQHVLLRYQPFPYQKFGSYQGMVKSISGSAVSPLELNQQIAGWSNFESMKEPIYRVTVELSQQTVTAYGKPVLLQTGTQVEADVMIENRTLIEWVLDPLYSLTGKLKQ